MPPGCCCAAASRLEFQWISTGRLIDKARQSGVRTLLDADGGPLQDGLDACPSVVTPNQREAERLLNQALITKNNFYEAATRIQAMGAESVILSLGSRGVVAAHGESITEVIAPRIDAVCPIGSGDALNAAFVWAMTQKRRFCGCCALGCCGWLGIGSATWIELC